MKRDFEKWIKDFKESISNYSYYVNFEKIYENVDKVKVELNILNSLIGSKTIEKDFQNIILKYPDTLECIPLLLAVRSNEIFVKDDVEEYLFNFSRRVYPIEDYVKFMSETGLFELLQNHIINNLYDYVLGIEVGLDSNGRKNRGGHLMENLVEKYILEAGFKKNIDYYKEMTSTEIEKKWKLDLSSLSANSNTVKRFDFVIKTKNCVYGIETNFYASGGSKLNETARSYKMIAEESKSINGFKFVWITDGLGWNSTKRGLKETFDILENLYCIKDMENGIFKSLKR